MNVVACFAKGWRTLTACASFIIVGALSVAGTLDLTPVVALFIKDPALLGAAMVGVGALFAGLRYISTTALGYKLPDNEMPDPEPRQKTDAGE